MKEDTSVLLSVKGLIVFFSLTVMLEGGFNDIQLPKLQKAIKTGCREAQAIIRAINQLADEAGRPKKHFKPYSVPPDIAESVK